MVQQAMQQGSSQLKAVEEASGLDDPAYVKTLRVAQVELLHGLKCDLQNALVLKEENKRFYNLEKIDVRQIAQLIHKTEKVCEKLDDSRSDNIRAIMKQTGKNLDDAIDEFFASYDISYDDVLDEIWELHYSYRRQLECSQYDIFVGTLNSMRDSSFQMENMDEEDANVNDELSVDVEGENCDENDSSKADIATNVSLSV